MSIWRSVAGMRQVLLTGADPESALFILIRHGIALYQIKKVDDLTVSFYILRSEGPRAEKICQKYGFDWKILGNHGIFWKGKALLRRPVLLTGCAFLLTLTLILPTRVLFVQVEGNQTASQQRILEAAEQCGIRFGASRSKVRSEQVKNALLAAVPELQWAGVNTAGCVATVTVRERTEQAEPPREAFGVSHIVASRDGCILSGTVRQGTGVFQEGQTVSEGDLLISGYTDCGLTVRAERAEGEIFAQTIRSFSAVTPDKVLQREATGRVRKKYSLLFGKKRINLWKDSGISDTTCGRMYAEYYITLPGGFCLPAALCVDTYPDYEETSCDVSQDHARGLMSSYARNCLLEDMTDGSILDKQEILAKTDGILRLSGQYRCMEMIGREQTVQIGEHDGKNS